ncbi:hypothetical protein [Candidatus Thiosymbion oneisti]
MITLDKDFGELAIVKGQLHNGIVRLVDIRAREQGKYCLLVLERYHRELLDGAIVVLQANRIRIRPSESPNSRKSCIHCRAKRASASSPPANQLGKRPSTMRDEYDFSQAKRAKEIPHLARLQEEAKGKSRITIMLDGASDHLPHYRRLDYRLHLAAAAGIRRRIRPGPPRRQGGDHGRRLPPTLAALGRRRTAAGPGARAPRL